MRRIRAAFYRLVALPVGTGRVLLCISDEVFALVAFSALTLLVGWHEGHPVRKKWGDGGDGYWLVHMEWCQAGWSVCLPLLIFPCTIKSRSFSSGTSSPRWSRKKGRKTVVV